MKSNSGNNLVVLGSVAVLAVYAAGYMRTKPAADRLAAQSAGRRPVAAAGGTRDGTVAATSTMSAPAVETPSRVATETVQIPAASKAIDSTGRQVGSAPALQPLLAKSVVIGDSTTTPTDSASLPLVASAPTAAQLAVPSPVPAQPATQGSAQGATQGATQNAEQNPAQNTTGNTAPKTAVRRDGMFIGRGTSRHGDIEAMIEIKDGRIVSAVISQCLTRYSCSWISALPGQVVARQSPDVDTVSGATQSADAFYWAIVQALSQAK